MEDAAKYHFLPYLRRGLVNAIAVTREDSSAHPRIPIQVVFGDEEGGDYTGGTASKTLQLLGPGEVTAIDTSLIVRTEPATRVAGDFSPNYFVHIEFAQPDLPWMFSTYTPDINSKLIPWMVLIVVRSSVAKLVKYPKAPLPALVFDGASLEQELPKLEESSYWAHVQIALEEGQEPADLDEEDIVAMVTDHPDRVVSRLISPRRLDPETDYLACVVPTFRVGVEAGLGYKNKNVELEFAWNWDGDEVLLNEYNALPVYYSWKVRTGKAGDFEELVKRLTPRAVDSDTGLRSMDIGHAGLSLPDAGEDNDKIMLLEGALVAPDMERGEWPDDDSSWTRDEFQNELIELLDAPALLQANSAEITVGPPLYGRWYARRDPNTVPIEGNPDQYADARPLWFRNLNIDPRERTVAGFGTRVIQQNQENLMYLAWEQIQDIKEANRLLIRTQFAREVNGSLYRRHFKRMPIDWLLALTWRVHWQILVGERSVATILNDCKTFRVVSSPWALHLMRPGGALLRAMRSDQDPYLHRRLPRLYSGYNEENGCDHEAVPPYEITIGTGTPCEWFEEEGKYDDSIIEESSPILESSPIGDGGWITGGCLHPTEDDIRNLPIQCDFTTIRLEPGGISFIREEPSSCDPAQDSPDFEAMRLIWLMMAAYFNDLHTMVAEEAEEECDCNLFDIRSQLLFALNPEITAVLRARSRIGLDSDLWDPIDPLHEIMAYPKLDQPMYEGLREYRQDHLLPGLDRVPPETITLVKTNPRFIGAFMTGLNHEFSRELLWREYPTDQAGTCFRQFWNAEAGIPPLPDEESSGYEEERDRRYDIGHIIGWDPREDLDVNVVAHPDGDVTPEDLEGRVVLLIRGELLKRYPSTIIYATKAEWEFPLPPENPYPCTKRKPVEWDENDEAAQLENEKYPIFQGTLKPDVTFFGFDLTVDEVRGVEIANGPEDDDKAGWYVVIKQQPFDPRFGMDVAEFPRPEFDDADGNPWDNLSWSHLAGVSGPDDLDDIDYVSAVPGGIDAPDLPQPPWAQWGHNSAHMAQITWQLPIRILIHADDMLKPEPQSGN